jgi:hypothetical protein
LLEKFKGGSRQASTLFSFLVSRFSFLVSRFSFLVSRFSFLVSRFSFLVSAAFLEKLRTEYQAFVGSVVALQCVGPCLYLSFTR